jgi:16S rRNA processing protein RimM
VTPAEPSDAEPADAGRADASGPDVGQAGDKQVDAERADAGRSAAESADAQPADLVVGLAPTQPPQPLPAGRVGRSHGLDGSFYVTGANPRLLSIGTTVTVAGASRAIVRRAGVDKHPILRLEGLEDRTAVQALRGTPLLVERKDAPPLAEGEWWAHELEGCQVGDGERSVGVVTGLLELPSCETLRVRRHDGSELLVPMVSNAIRQMDIPHKRIDIDLGFLGESEA